MLNFNTHSKSLPQKIAEVYFFNETGSDITLKMGQAVHYTPGATLSDGATALKNKNIVQDNWGDPDGDLIPAIRARIVTLVDSVADLDFAGIVIKSVEVPNNTGAWIKISQPGGFAKCLIGASSTAPGQKFVWKAGAGNFAAIGTNKVIGAGVVRAIETISAAGLCWCKILSGDGALLDGSSGSTAAPGKNMIA